MPASPARAAALDILLRVERESSYASELLHSPAHSQLSTPDHALIISAPVALAHGGGVREM